MDQRYYAYQAGAPTGRFLSPDPGGIRTADPSNPQSWNRFAYVYDDPANFRDRRGLFASIAGGYGDDEDPEEGDAPLPTPYPGPPQPARQLPPTNLGGWNTNPSGTGKTALQYLTSIWQDCLDDFEQDNRFDTAKFEGLLTGGMKFLDTRNQGIANQSVGTYAKSGDTTHLSDFVGSASAQVILGTNWVVLGQDYFTDNTQTEQIGIAVHEALHLLTYSWGEPFKSGGDDALAGWLENFGFQPSNDFSSHEITDWIVGTADHMSTNGGGCKYPKKK